MAKKTDKAVTDLAREIKKLRKGNEKLAETLEKAREDQAESHREILALLEERSTTRDAGPAGIAESAPTETNGGPDTAETAATEDRAPDTAGSQEGGHTPDAEAEQAPEVTEAAGRRAKELSVDPSNVKGTGSGGRVLVKDVEAAANAGR